MCIRDSIRSVRNWQLVVDLFTGFYLEFVHECRMNLHLGCPQQFGPVLVPKDKDKSLLNSLGLAIRHNRLQFVMRGDLELHLRVGASNETLIQRCHIRLEGRDKVRNNRGRLALGSLIVPEHLIVDQVLRQDLYQHLCYREGVRL